VFKLKFYTVCFYIRSSKLLQVQTEMLSCRSVRMLKEICFDCGVIQLLGKLARNPRSSWIFSSHFLILTVSRPIRFVTLHLIWFHKNLELCTCVWQRVVVVAGSIF